MATDLIDTPDSAADSGSTPAPLIPAIKVVAVPLDEQPVCGGSYTRNADGTLTQTEGHGFADDQPTQE